MQEWSTLGSGKKLDLQVKTIDYCVVDIKSTGGAFCDLDWQSLVSLYWVTVAPIINSPCVHVHVYVYVSYYHIMLEMLLLKATRKQHEVCGGPGESLQQMTVMSLK